MINKVLGEEVRMAIEELVVLGIIPGTNIQVGFWSWAALFGIAVGLRYVVKRERREHDIRFLLIRLSLAFTVRRLQRA